MIIWSRWGVVVFLILMTVMISVQLVAESVTGNSSYWQDNSYLLTLSFFISGVSCWFLGKWMNKPKAEKKYIDKETKQEVSFPQRKHTFFFIPVEYWGPIFLVIGVICLFASLN